jgi:tRNA nucleotidyltransferase (CCA-adding enzyme)
MIGLLLRNKAVHNVNTGANWTTSLLFALVQELVPHYNVLSDKLDGRHRNQSSKLV